MTVTTYSKVRFNTPIRYDTVIRGWKQDPIDRSVALPYQQYSALLAIKELFGGMSDFAVSTTHSDELNLDGMYLSVSANGGPLPPPISATEFWRAYNRAYEKFRGKVSETVDVTTTLAERASTMEMVGNRVGQLFKAYRELRRGRFRGFVKALDVRPLPKDKSRKRSAPKDASGIWLEYWFGWKPTVSDIYNGVQMYGSPIPDTVLQARSLEPVTRFKKGSGGSFSTTTSITGEYRIKIRGRVVVTNPSRFEANRWGIVNPAITAWELVPFSFVIDWFSNIGQCIASYSDWVGLSLSDTTLMCKLHYESEVTGSNWGVPGKGFHKVRIFNHMSRASVKNLPKPRLALSFPNISPARIATSVALLVQLLKK